MKKNTMKAKKYKEAVETTMYFMRIADVIFKARKEKGLSQQGLAKGVKTTQRIISMIENADNYNTGGDLLYRIFKFLGKEMIVDGKDMITGREKSYTIQMGGAENISKAYNYSETEEETCANGFAWANNTSFSKISN